MPFISNFILWILMLVGNSDMLVLRGGTTSASVCKIPNFEGKGPAVSKQQPPHRIKIYHREKEFLEKIKELGLDSEDFPRLLSYNDNSRTIYMSYLDDSNAPGIQTIEYKDSLSSILHRLAVKHEVFHNDVKWDNVKYDITRKRPVFIDFDWSSHSQPGFPYYGPLQLAVPVAHHEGAHSLCALNEKRKNLQETCFLYSLNDKGIVMEHQRCSTKWVSRELMIPKFRTISCAFDEYSQAKLLYGADEEGRVWEVWGETLRCATSSAQSKIHGYSPIVSLVLSSPSIKLVQNSSLLNTNSNVTAREMRDDATTAVPPSRRWSCVRALFFVGTDGQFRAASLDYVGRWHCECIRAPKSCYLPATIPGFRFAAVAPPTSSEGSGAVSIFYFSKTNHLCELLWDGPSRASMREVKVQGMAPWGQVCAESVSAVWIDPGPAAVYFKGNNGQVWECRVDLGRGNASLHELEALDGENDERIRVRSTGERLVSSALPRSREEGGGFAGRELVSSTMDGYLVRHFTGGSRLERSGPDWHRQELTHPRLGSALLKDVARGLAEPIAELATAGGSHFIFYVDQEDNVVEL